MRRPAEHRAARAAAGLGASDQVASQNWPEAGPWRLGRAGSSTQPGRAVYALRRPDPAPAVFGYLEVFYLLVIAGVAAYFLAISLFTLPTG